ncbi:MAG: MFS transporter [Pseudomonadota bacterium]
MCLVLGSIHAFSVFLEPLESRFGTSRATASLAYSFALVALTAVVLLGPRIYGRFSASVLMAVSAAVAALGAIVAALAPSMIGVWVGYSLLFGAANGLGYGYGLQLAAHANPGREGLAMGIVTAAYAVGATLAPAAFLWALGIAGFEGAMGLLAGALVLAGLGAVLCLRGRALNLPISTTDTPHTDVATSRVVRLWVTYGAGVFAGLMIIGHAAEIARASGSTALLWIAPTALAVCNMGGSLIAGALADHVPGRLLQVGFVALAGLALVWLTMTGVATQVLGAIGVVGFCYGGIIAATPAIIAKAHGMAEGPRLYGRVFTAWGVAGLAGPWLAGLMFDRTGSYEAAIWTAAALSLMSALLALSERSAVNGPR